MSTPEIASKMTDAKDEQYIKPIGVAYLIGRLDRSLERSIRAAIAPFGVTLSQYTSLTVFSSSRSQLSNAQLAERTLVSPQAANELIKTMEKKRWIVRQPDPSHGRIIQISLTDEGRALLKRCDTEISKLEMQMLEEFSEEERETLKNQLRTLVKNLVEF